MPPQQPQPDPQYGPPQQPQQPAQPVVPAAGQQPAPAAQGQTPVFSVPPQPQYQYPAPAIPEADQNPYDFFMESRKPKRGLGLGGGSNLQKIVFVGAVLVVVMVVLGSIIAINNKPTGNSLPLTTIAQEQTEIIRVAADGSKNSHSDRIHNFTATTQTSMASSQQSLLKYMAKHGIKVSDKVLALGHSAETDQALTAALAADTYDTTFTSIMQADLDKYIHNLEREIAVAQGPAEKALLQQDDKGAQLLKTMLNAQ